MRFCPFCAQEVEDDATQCLYCGKRLAAKSPTAAPISDQPATAEQPAGESPAPPTVAPPPPFPAPMQTAPPGNLERHDSTALGASPPAAPATAEATAGETNQTQYGFAPAAPAPPPPEATPPAEAPLPVAPPADVAAPEAPQPGPTPPPESVPALLQARQAETVPAGVPPTAPSTSTPREVPPTAPVGPVSGPGANLEPMPPDGPPSFFAGLPYFFRVFLLRLKYGTAIGQQQRELTAERRRLDETLRDLGERAREMTFDYPALRPAITAVAALEQERGAAHGAQAALDAQLATEEQRVAAVGADCDQRVGAAQQELQQAQGQLQQVEEQLKQATSEASQHARQVKTLTKQQTDKRAAATKSQDPAEQQRLQREVADTGVRIGDLDGKRGAAQAQADQLRPAVAQHRASVEAIRARIHEINKERQAAQQELAAKKRQIDEEKRKKGLQQGQLEQLMQQRLLELGQALDTERVAVDSLGTFYSAIDGLRAAIAQREGHIGQLSSERESYDRAAFNNGLIIFAGSTGILVAGLLVLILVLAL